MFRTYALTVDSTPGVQPWDQWVETLGLAVPAATGRKKLDYVDALLRHLPSDVQHWQPSFLV